MSEIRALIALVAAGLAVRQAVLQALRVSIARVTGATQASEVLLLAWVVAATIAVAFVVWLLRTRRPRHLGVAALGALAVLAGLASWNLQQQQVEGAYFTWGFTPLRTGPFPYEPGRVIRENRQGYTFETTVLPDGTRPCGEANGTPTVAFVGDSFMFGSGVPDEGTLCWQLRERLSQAGLAVRGVNLGQPGANLASSIETVQLALTRYQPAVVVISVLPGDDTRPFDLNGQNAARESLWFRVAAAVFEAEPVWLALSLAYEVVPADFWEEASVQHSLARLRDIAAASGTPIVVEVLGTEPTWLLAMYDREVDKLVATTPNVRRVPLVEVLSREADQDPPTVIPGDGHPTAHGNAARAAGLLPVVVELLSATASP